MSSAPDPTVTLGPGAAAPTLASEHADLLVALDRMLTVGSYYPPGHEKYREVATAAHRAVARAEGPQGGVMIEVTDTGLNLGASFAPADGREAKRLHKLLVPLDIALLEIDTAATADQLHEALVVLKKAQASLSATRTWRTVDVSGLPPTVRVTNRTLYVKMKHKLVGSGGTRPNVDAFDPNTIPDAMLVSTPDGQKLERDFLAVVRGIILGGDPGRLRQLAETPVDRISEALGEWIPDAAIRAMKAIIDRLAETNSDPLVLESLVQHAKKALELTGESTLVELAFERLRVERELKHEARPLLENRPKPKSNRRQPVVYTMTRAQLGALVDEVGAQVRVIEDLSAPANADCLGICCQILASGPAPELAKQVADLMQALVGNQQHTTRDLEVARDALRSAFADGWTDRTSDLARSLLEPLRVVRPDRLSWMWMATWEGLLEKRQKEAAWPFLVNDLLLGMTWTDEIGRLQLLTELTGMDVRERGDLLARLEALPALREKKAVFEILDTPAPLLFPLYRLLLRSSLSEEFGPRLLDRLRKRPPHPLVAQLLAMMGPWDRGQLRLYQVMLDQGVAEAVHPPLAEAAGRYLRAIITRLDDDELSLPWVPDAIHWLSRLRPQAAVEILRDVVEERRWLFLPVWPAECRDAAREALERLKGTAPAAAPAAGDRGTKDAPRRGGTPPSRE